MHKFNSSSMDARESFDYYQTNNQQLYDFQSDSYFEPQEDINRGLPTCNSMNNCSESGIQEETEVVDELTQILVDCLKKAGVRTQEILLRKFFSEIEKDSAMEIFLLERLQNSKLNHLFHQSMGRMQDTYSDDELATTGISVRELDTSAPERMERFKVKTVKVGNIVKEEESD